MSIIRGPRPDSNFYLLNKAISEDKRLGWAARGLLVYLLGKPDNWQVSVQALINETADASTSTGKDTVYKLLGDLEAAGYITRSQAKVSGGKFAPIDYVVSEVPVSNKPQPLPALPHTENTEAVDSPLPEIPEAAKASPLPGLPLTAEPLPVKPTQVSTEVKQGLKEPIPPNPQGGAVGTETSTRKTKRAPSLTLQAFIAECKANGEPVVSGYLAVIDYAEQTGLGADLLNLCWSEFKRRHLPGGTADGKRYKDWRKAFFNCVQGNWYKLWYLDNASNTFMLTTTGKQADRANEVPA